MNIRRILSVILALILFCSSAAFAQAPAGPVKEWAWTVYGDLDTADPYGSTSAQSMFFSNMTHNTLTYVDADTGEIMPELAKEWTDVNGDGLVWDIKLNEGVTFHDGTVLTAEDVKFTWEYCAPDAGNVVKPNASMNYVAGIEAVDATTVRFNLKSSMPDFPSYLETKIYSKNAFDTMDKAAAALVGTGPYMFDAENTKTGIQFVATRYDAYWGGIENHPTKHIGWKVSNDANTMQAMLRAGEIDWYDGFTASAWNNFASDESLITESRSGAQSYYLGFNYANKALQDVELRKAIAMAINREDIVAVAMEGGIGGMANGNFCVPTGLGFKDVEPIGYDPEAAQAKLNELGYGDGLTLKVIFYLSCAKIAEVLQADLSLVNINLELQQVDSANWTPMKASKEGYDVFLDYCSYQGALLYNFNRFFYSNGSSNVFGYNNPEYEAMQDKVLAASDWNGMLSAFGDLQEWVVANVPVFPLVRNNYLAARHPNVGGLVLAPTNNYIDYSTVYVLEG